MKTKSTKKGLEAVSKIDLKTLENWTCDSEIKRWIDPPDMVVPVIKVENLPYPQTEEEAKEILAMAREKIDSELLEEFSMFQFAFLKDCSFVFVDSEAIKNLNPAVFLDENYS